MERHPAMMAIQSSQMEHSNNIIKIKIKEKIQLGGLVQSMPKGITM